MHPALRLLVGFSLAPFIVACDGGGGGGHGSTAAGIAPSATPVVFVHLGTDVPPRVAARVETLLRAADPRPVEVAPATSAVPALPSGSLVLALGECPTTRAVLPQADVRALGSEAFRVVSQDLGNGVTLLAADGNVPDPDPHPHGNRGLVYGAYAALEQLGIGFLHPLEPTLPAGLLTPAGVDLTERPRWPTRGWHLHTMHPLELTDLLNGWGPGGPQDEPGWRAMLPEWERCCEWLVANRQNEVEWVLLGADSWRAFADGPERQARLMELVAIAQGFGLVVGADTPLALKQQHGWHLLRTTNRPLADEVAEIEGRLDWVIDCGFDAVSTELGFSEFTHPDDRKMLAWLDAFTAKVAARGRSALVKAHVSQGQSAPNFVDPVTGSGPCNFNFLPHYADPRLGVLPHTVQHYGLDDPAPTYGATDFDFMRRFLHREAGTRRTIWYPETAYWVSFDVDVPLFLGPLYAERRLHDLRLLAADERAGTMAKMDGQYVFSSGWEWGYWLQEVVAARAAWDPLESAATDEEAFRRALDPVVRPFGPRADDLRDLIVRVAKEQKELLIEGKVNGASPSTVVRRNGQAYLQGLETWDEVSELAGLLTALPAATTQPSRLTLHELRRGWPVWSTTPDYRREVAPLLAEMTARLRDHADALEALGSGVPPEGAKLWAELSQTARVTALRAEQVQGLYEYVDADRLGNRAAGLPWLQTARDALDRAQGLVAAREAAYRVPVDRIAGWGDNPTCYEYGYLWTVHSLHFWWRDEGQAVDAPYSPAYLNIIDPIDTAFGEGIWSPIGPALRAVAAGSGWSSIADFFAPPPVEPVYPPAGLRNRP